MSVRWYRLNADHSVTLLEHPTPADIAAAMNVDRTVGKTDVGPYRVSTVFLSLDHNSVCGDPHIFETMVFGGRDDDAADEFEHMERRYSTWDDALAGHNATVAVVQQHEELVAQVMEAFKEASRLEGS